MRPSAMETNELQAVFSGAFGMLIRYYNGEEDQQATKDNLTCILVGLVWHRESVRKNIIDKATIYFWISERIKGAAVLAPRCGRKPVYHNWGSLFLKIYQRLRLQKLSASEIARDWDTYYPGIPGTGNARAAQRFLEEIPAEFKNFSRMGKNAIRAIKSFVRRTMDGL